MRIIIHPNYIESSIHFNDLSEGEQSSLDYLFDMMAAVKQQILLREAMCCKDKKE